MTRQYYAHSLEGKPPSEWQPLEEHLLNVTELPQSFTAPGGCALTPLSPCSLSAFGLACPPGGERANYLPSPRGGRGSG